MERPPKRRQSLPRQGPSRWNRGRVLKKARPGQSTEQGAAPGPSGFWVHLGVRLAVYQRKLIAFSARWKTKLKLSCAFSTALPLRLLWNRPARSAPLPGAKNPSGAGCPPDRFCDRAAGILPRRAGSSPCRLPERPGPEVRGWARRRHRKQDEKAGHSPSSSSRRGPLTRLSSERRVLRTGSTWLGETLSSSMPMATNNSVICTSPANSPQMPIHLPWR